MFDTLVFPEPIDCVQCGEPVPSTQTKSLDSTLDTYRVGDVVSAEGFTLKSIVEEYRRELGRAGTEVGLW